MKCADIKRGLSQGRDVTLADALGFEAHRATCPACQGWLTELESNTDDFFSLLGRSEARPGAATLNVIRSGLTEQRPPWQFRGQHQVALAALILLVLWCGIVSLNLQLFGGAPLVAHDRSPDGSAVVAEQVSPTEFLAALGTPTPSVDAPNGGTATPADVLTEQPTAEIRDEPTVVAKPLPDAQTSRPTSRSLEPTALPAASTALPNQRDLPVITPTAAPKVPPSVVPPSVVPPSVVPPSVVPPSEVPTVPVPTVPVPTVPVPTVPVPPSVVPPSVVPPSVVPPSVVPPSVVPPSVVPPSVVPTVPVPPSEVPTVPVPTVPVPTAIGTTVPPTVTPSNPGPTALATPGPPTVTPSNPGPTALATQTAIATATPPPTEAPTQTIIPTPIDSPLPTDTPVSVASSYCVYPESAEEN